MSVGVLIVDLLGLVDHGQNPDAVDGANDSSIDTTNSDGANATSHTLMTHGLDYAGEGHDTTHAVSTVMHDKPV